MNTQSVQRILSSLLFPDTFNILLFPFLDTFGLMLDQVHFYNITNIAMCSDSEVKIMFTIKFVYRQIKFVFIVSDFSET